MPKQVIHAIKKRDREAETITTLCGLVGAHGHFKVVEGTDPFQGPTCGQCRKVARLWRMRGPT